MSTTPNDTPEIPLKKCGNPECGKEYPATTEYFYRSPPGLSRLCKKCYNARGQQWRNENKDRCDENGRIWRSKNREKVKSYKRNFRRRHPEKHRAEVKEWRKRNPEKHREQNRRWRANNLDKSRASGLKWSRRISIESPDRLRIITERRLARKRHLPDTLTVTEWEYALEYFNGCCAVCGRPLRDLFGTHTVAMDHWIPLASPDCPGTVVTNMVPLCQGQLGCNNKKGAKDPFKWLEQEYSKRKAKKILARIKTYFEHVRGLTV